MDFDRGNSVSGQKDFQIQGSWIPATPVKPILPRPQPIYANRQDNELLWMVGGGGSGSGFSNGFSRENQAQGIAASFDSTVGFEPDTGFHNWEAALAPKSQASGNNVGGSTYENGSSIDPMTDGWNNIPFVDLLAQAASGATSSQPDVIAATSNYDFGFNSQMGSSGCWSESTCVSSLPATNHDLSLGSQLWTNGTCTPQRTQCKLPVSCQQNYDLNALPGTMAELFSRRYSQFAPITPDNAKRLESQNVSEVTNQCMDGRTNRENDNQKNNEVDTTRADVIELQCEKELSQADSSLPAISTPATDNQNLEKGSNNDGIDLNKTPQQKPRRKKHRPKVVIEGKPKRTPKPATPKPNASNENPTGKRKYVRRKGLDKPQTTPPPDVVRETTDPKQVEPTTRSARRVLNFELDGQGIHGSSQEQQFYNGNVQTKSTVQLCQGIEVTVGNTQTGIAHELVCSVNQVLQDYISLPTRQTPSTRHPTNIDHPYSPATTGPPHERLKANARIGNDIQGTGQVTADDKQGRHEQIMLRFNEQFTTRSPNDSNCSTSASLAEGQATGNKRACAHITDRVDHGTMNINGTRCNSMQDYEAFRVNEFSRMSSMHFPEIYKKRRTEKGQTSTTSSTSSTVTTAKNVIKLVQERLQNQTKASLLESKPNGWVSAPQFHMTRAPTTQGEAVRGVDEDKLRAFECMMALGRTERLTKKRSKGPTRVRDLASLTGIAENKLLATLPGKRALLGGEAQGAEISHGPQNCIEALVAETRATLARRKRSKKRNSFINSVPSSTNALQLHQNSVLYARQKFLSGQTGPPPEVIWKHMLSVDAITERLKHLDINLESNMVSYQEYNNALVPYTVRYQEQNALLPYNMVNQEQNALVIYKRDGTIVSFDGPFDPIKKRRPRPKVDLDDETTRVWKLLLENIDNEGIDGTDEDKARWWEEERRVFRGRADSFIARMHLVQGDRRFSKWKGSVVDSVVGVFLTQNVSDHLSSSAYMSLAARYPLKPKSNQQQCYEEGTSILVEEPELCILDMQDTINWEEKIPDNLVCDQSSMTQYDPEHSEEKEVANSNESFGSSTGGLNSINDSKTKLDFSGSELENFHESAVKRSSTQPMERGEASILGDRTAIEDVVSSQSSVDSSIAQTAERRIGPFLESNSEAQDPAAGPNSTSFEGSTSFLKLLHMAAAPMFNEGHSKGSHLVPSEKNSKDACNQLDVIGHDKQRQNLDQLDDPESSLISSAPPTDRHSNLTPNLTVQGVECIELLEEESRSSDVTDIKNENRMCARSRFTEESSSKDTLQTKLTVSVRESLKVSWDSSIQSTNNFENERNETDQSQGRPVGEPKSVESLAQGKNNELQQNINLPHFLGEILDVTESTSALNNRKNTNESNLKEPDHASVKALNETAVETLPGKRRRVVKEKNKVFDWDSLRKQAQVDGKSREKTANTMDSLDWEAVRCADVNEIAYTIRERGMNNMLAERIKDFLNRLVREHGSLDLEWLRDVPPDKAKEYLLSIRGLGLKSVECVRLLTLHHLAFPVDTNVGRIAVRLGWVPLQPLPESLQLHLLEMYPVLESIQKYLWPRLCKLDQRTLYELHYQMITFGKVFCTKSKPNCNACPMRGECRHFASAFASARLALPEPEEKSIVSATENRAADQHAAISTNRLQLPLPEANDQSIVSHQLEANQPSEATQPSEAKCCNNEPIIEVPATPEPECTQISESDIEDACYEDPDEIPTIKLNIEEFTQNLQNYMQNNMELQEGEMSRALVALTPDVASIPTPKLKNVSRLRTEHQVYELPDSHPLLQGLERREPDDPCSYLLAIWTPGETANSIQPPEGKCSSQEVGELCAEKTCFSCNSIREANTQTVRGTLLIPCRTAMRGSFPLNGTYFQVNEVFADHDSSLNPIDVPRSWIWNLPRRTVYFGTSIPTIFKGLSTEGIQYCFWRGFVCVRGFDQKTRAPRPLMARLHFPASKLVKTKAKPPGE